jgi:hypothetical protein
MNIRDFPLAGQIFQSKASLRKTLTAIVESREAGSRLSGTEDALIREVVGWHPDAATKIGPGIRSFRIERHPTFRSPMLVLERTNGTETDVSYLAAIARIGRPANDNGHMSSSVTRASFIRAAREAIRHQVEAFRRAAQTAAADPLGRMRCEVTDALLSPNAVDIDHDLPWDFASIIEAFVAERELVFAQVDIRGFEDGSTRRCFADPKLAEAFADFHLKRARLRVIDRAVHRRISAEACSRAARNRA